MILLSKMYKQLQAGLDYPMMNKKHIHYGGMLVKKIGMSFVKRNRNADPDK